MIITHSHADTYEQLGYQAESGIWRNFYLTGALGLRHGVVGKESALAPSRDLLKSMAVRLDGSGWCTEINRQ